MSQFDTLHTPRCLRVQIPQAISVLDYAPSLDSASETLRIGQVVVVPLARQQRIGVIIAQHDEPPKEFSLKPILRVLSHIPLLTQAQMNYLWWLAKYYMVPNGLALRLCLSARPEFYEPIEPKLSYGDIPSQNIPKLGKVEQRLFDTVCQQTRQKQTLTKQCLLKLAKAKNSQLQSLIQKGIVKEFPAPKVTYHPRLLPLNDEQQASYQQMRENFLQASPKVVLLEGQTGSGKTEVYFKLIADTLALGKQVLVLLPEISLLSDWQSRFTERFGKRPPAWHAGVTAYQRRRIWQEVASGEIPLLVGARSALHLPFARLGLVIIDEEHDFSYKQEDGIPYHARDMAVIRTREENIPLLLASATPSLESQANAERGRYVHILLPQRYGKAQMPDIQTIDLLTHRPKAASWLSPVLLEALGQNLSKGEQSLLFLNRRGYAPLLLCGNCGYRVSCPNCSLSLTEHTHPERHLECHHCAYRCQIPHACPDCDSTKHWRSSGPGVERITSELLDNFPTARHFEATSETLGDEKSVQEFLNKMLHRKIDIIIGTQIIAKGLDFPYLTLAGIVDGDQALFGNNPRSSEQTWQLLQQVAGRTGRHALAGKALIQTQSPNDPLFIALCKGDKTSFWDQQKRLRKLTRLPPFGRLVAIIVQSRNKSLAEKWARNIALLNPKGNHYLLGPTPAPIAKLRNYHRFRLLLMSGRAYPLQPVLQDIMGKILPPSTVRIKIDVDPYNFM